MPTHWILSTLLVGIALCAIGIHAAPQPLIELLALGERLGRVHGDLKEEDHKFVTDPSANSDVFQKEGDMTFILGTNPFIRDGPATRSGNAKDPHTDRERRNAVLEDDMLWPGGIVPYEISSIFDEYERFIILSAMNHWEEKTCIRFKPKNSTNIYYVLIMSGPLGVCQSFVGRIHSFQQPQGLTLGPTCVNFPTVVHELGHAIGFYHEHNRPDRDQHVEILYNNMFEAGRNQYVKNEDGTTRLLGYGYDHASIMHYDKDFFSKNFMDTMQSRDPTIPLGGAEELSPLDIAKANTLYNCGPKENWPPICTIAPPKPMLSLPPGSTCGQVSNGRLNGTFSAPGYPNYQHNLDCAYVVRVPKGYYVQVSLPNFAIEESAGCTKDYVQFYYGSSLRSEDLVVYSIHADNGGRFCDSQSGRFLYTLTETATVFLHTDGSGSGSQAFQLSFKAVDVNECKDDTRTCHNCTNFVGGFDCGCNDGYYHSPAAQTCYDVNECAYSNGGCQHQCFNSGGSYRCECNSGYYLQADGKSCATTPPVVTCGSNFTAPSGTLQTPNWPQTYPNNIDCEWFIWLPNSDKVVEISCGETEPYGIAGSHPECTEDYIAFYDGHTKQSSSYGPYCGSTKPNGIKMSSNLAKVVFHAGSTDSSSRKGAQCTFRSVDGPTTPPPTTPSPPTTPPPTTPPPTTLPPTTSPPTTPPPTTPSPPTTSPPTTPPTATTVTMTTTPPPLCGGVLTTSSGTFQTPNWPETYPVNIDCEWRIQLPDESKVVEIRCEENPFGIAGSLPACNKDYLKFYDGHSKQDTESGPFCHYTKPNTATMSSNKAMAIFHAGPRHNSARRGFKCSFQSKDLSSTPQCGGTFTAASGSFQTPNWPETYPVNIDCEWRIQLPDESKVVEIRCEENPFGIAGSLPTCNKDYLKFYDGHSKQDTESGPFCHYTKPNTATMSSNKAMAIFHAGPRHNSARRGFKCSFQSIDLSSTPQCGGTFTAASGSFQTPNWPQTYPININCTWTIILPDSSKRVEIYFDSPFGIAGSLPACVKDKLHIHDDLAGTVHGPYCHFALPSPPIMSSNQARVVFSAGPAHNPSRVGFKANYRSA